MSGLLDIVFFLVDPLDGSCCFESSGSKCFKSSLFLLGGSMLIKFECSARILFLPPVYFLLGLEPSHVVYFGGGLTLV